MPIEFDCGECKQHLRVPDSAHGKRAKCPQCGAIITVPGPPPTSSKQGGGTDFPSSPTPPGAAPGAGGSPADRAFSGQNPFAERLSSEFQDEKNPFADTAQFDQAGINPYSPPSTKADAMDQAAAPETTDVLGYAWDVWKANLGLLVGVFVFISVVGWMFEGVQNGIQFSLVQGGMAREEAELATFPLALVSALVQFYLGIGATLIGLRLARGQSAEFTDVFTGGSLFLPALGASILFGLALAAGLALLIVPGIFVALLFWPYYYLVVERKAGVIESFSIAYQMSSQNMGTTFLLALANFGIVVLGFLALCLGLFLAIPLTQMV